jgi:hypothetical protein
MDQVRSPRRIGAFGTKARHRALNAIQRASGRAEEPEPSRARRFGNHFHRRDAVGHFAGDVREADSVAGCEGGVAQIFGPNSGKAFDWTAGFNRRIESESWLARLTSAQHTNRPFVMLDGRFQVFLGTAQT